VSRKPLGLDNGLTNYGDRDFARYLRRSFAKSMGYSNAVLDRQIVGICSWIPWCCSAAATRPSPPC
jgi:dihydroxy-acid dehydratase